MMKTITSFYKVPLSAMLIIGISISLVSGEAPSQTKAHELNLISQMRFKVAWVIRICDVRLYSYPDKFDFKNRLSGIPLALEIEYLRDANAQKLIEIANEGLALQFDETTNQSFSQTLTTLHSHYQNISKGDVYRIDYTPGSGMNLSFNGQHVVQINDDEFARYYLHVWLGDNPMSKPIVNGLHKNALHFSQPTPNQQPGVSTG